MFETIDKTQKIWVYDTQKQAFILYFPTFLDALKFLVIHGDEFLGNINMGNDKIPHLKSISKWQTSLIDYYDSVTYVERRYIFIDGENRCIDFREHAKEIDNLSNWNSFNCNRYNRHEHKAGFNQAFKFRIDPVPGTGHLGRYRWLRHIRTTNEKRQNCDPETKPYVRPARRANSLPSLYDDIPRSYSKSWKDCTKKRKQWM